MKFSSEKELKLFLKLETHKHLTSDSFSAPDREYIFLSEDNLIKFKRLDGALETFNFERHNNLNFRNVIRLY